MQIAVDTARFTDAMVAGCGLDSASIFLSDRSGQRPGLSYLYHVGVSEEAQQAYADRVFESDPFTDAIRAGTAAAPGLVRWEDDRLAPAIDRARDYRGFIACHHVEVVGAYVRRLAPELFLLIGVHCRPGHHARTDVAFTRLEREIETVASMVTTQMLGDVLASAPGRAALGQALGDAAASATMTLAGVRLSQRESEIARLICRGEQNKVIAGLMGLSEYTVENYLRRVYRKLGIHNRAALVAKVSGTLH